MPVGWAGTSQKETEQPGEVVRPSRWCRAEDVAKVLRHRFTLTQFTG